MTDHPDQAMAAQLAAELPGFWAFFYDRHPKFNTIRTPAGPIGWLHMGEVYEAIGDTITAYAAEARKRGPATIHALQLVTVGEGFRFDPDELLEANKGKGFTNLVIIGELPGEPDVFVAGMANAGEALILMERAKMQIVAP